MREIFISLCMIVKNEESYLPSCLDSVKGVVDEMIIVDTGSTDRTKEIALSYGAKIYDFEWIDDFSAARNYGIEKATGEWILVLDADEELEEETAKRLRDELKATTADALILLRKEELEGQMYADYDLAGLLRVFRNRKGYFYERMYHEEINARIERLGGKIETRYDLMIWHHGIKSQIVQGDTKRFERAIRILQKAIEQYPSNYGLYIFLGLEFYNAGEYEKAKQALLYALKSNLEGLKLSLIHEAYTILGYIALYERDTESAKNYAYKALEVHKLYENFMSSQFLYRHTLSLLGLSLMEDAHQQALDGRYALGLANAKEAQKIFLELKSYPDQPDKSKERIKKLLSYCDNLITILQKSLKVAA